MNPILQTTARTWLITHLELLPAQHIKLFRRMYEKQFGTQSIQEVVDDMEEGKLDWAMTQIQNTFTDSLRIKDKLGVNGILFEAVEDNGWKFYKEDDVEHVSIDGIVYDSIYKAIYWANEWYSIREERSK